MTEAKNEMDEIRNETKKLIQMLESLEMRARNIQSEFSLATLDPTDNYSLAKQIIESEIVILSTSVSELKKLVFRIQDRQELLYVELNGKNKNLEETLSKINEKVSKLEVEDIKLKKKLEDAIVNNNNDLVSLKIQFDHGIDEMKETFNTNLTMSETALRDELNDLKETFNTNLTMSETALRDELNDLKETSNNNLTMVETSLRDDLNDLKEISNNNLVKTEISLRGDMNEVKDKWLSKIDEAKAHYDGNLSMLANSIRSDINNTTDKIQKDYKMEDSSLLKEINALKRAFEVHTQALARYVINLSEETGKFQVLGRLALNRTLESMAKNFSFTTREEEKEEEEI